MLQQCDLWITQKTVRKHRIASCVSLRRAHAHSSTIQTPQTNCKEVNNTAITYCTLIVEHTVKSAADDLCNKEKWKKLWRVRCLFRLVMLMTNVTCYNSEIYKLQKKTVWKHTIASCALLITARDAQIQPYGHLQAKWTRWTILVLL